MKSNNSFSIRRWVFHRFAGYQFYLILLVIFAVIRSTYAQIPQNSIGQNPLSLRWSQINNDSLQVVFPRGLESRAQRVANIAGYLYSQDNHAVTEQNHKVTILLHGQNLSSNGYVTVAPFRSEFYTTPPQFGGNVNWIDHLAIHEYRHVQQFANTRQGITKWGRNLFGSWFWGGISTMTLPRWYWEGDAVIAETILTHGGRGRLPSFNMEYHALLRDNNSYSFEKAAAGSYRDIVPSWYPLGYNILSYTRENYDTNIWQKVASDGVRYKGIFYPFSKSIKKHTGLTMSSLYERTMDNLKEKWFTTDSHKNDLSTCINCKETPDRTVIHYNAAIPLDDGSVVMLQSGFDRLYALVRKLPNKKIENLTEIGIQYDRQMTTINYFNGLLIWSQFQADHRRGNRSYADIYTYDLKSRKKKKITNRGTYFSPSFHVNGKDIIAIHIDPKTNQSSIISLNLSDGNIVKTIVKSRPHQFIGYPTAVTTTLIAYISTENQRSQIRIYDSATGTDSVLYQAGYNSLTHLSASNEYLVFSQSDGYVNNIFRLNTHNGAIHRISDSIVGAYQPRILGNKVYYSVLTSRGFRVHEQAIKPQKVTKDPIMASSLYPSIDYQEGGDILDSLTQIEFPVKKFSKFSGLINPHSLLLDYNTPEVSLSLLSDNKFGTLSTYLTTTYNANENRMNLTGGLRYAELYPIITSDYSIHDRAAIEFNFSALSDTSSVYSSINQSWSENNWSIGTTVPYNFSQGLMSNSISATVRLGHKNIKVDDVTDGSNIHRDTIMFSESFLSRFENLYSETLRSTKFYDLDYSLSLRMLKYRALQHVAPRLGFTAYYRHRSPLGGDHQSASNDLLRFSIYLPGIHRNHSLYCTGHWQWENTLSSYRYSDVFRYARGYDYSLRRDNYQTWSINYAMPLLYPDMAIGPLAFIKRIKSTIFYDHTRVKHAQFPYNEEWQRLNSAGIELGIDARLFRLVEVDFSVRYSYLFHDEFNNNRNHQFDFLIFSIRPH